MRKMHNCQTQVAWLSGEALDLQPAGRWFDPCECFSHFFSRHDPAVYKAIKKHPKAPTHTWRTLLGERAVRCDAGTALSPGSRLRKGTYLHLVDSAAKV